MTRDFVTIFDPENLERENGTMATNEQDADVPLEDKEEDDDTPLGSIASIWDDEYVEVYLSNGNKLKWKCGWCKGSFAGKNSTKAICHLAKVGRSDIRICKGRINERYKK